MRWLLAVLAWVAAAAVLAPICFFATLVLAAPHSSLLPGPLQPLVLVLGWATLLVGPVLAARAVWRRSGRGSGQGGS